MAFRDHIKLPNSARKAGNCLIVGEVAQAHDGSLGIAHAFIEAIANAGADAVKFQTHIAAAESTPSEPWRVKFSLQDARRYDYWKRMEFTESQWGGLKQHAEERGLIFLSSPFSHAAVQLLQRLGIAAWKVASGELSNELIFAQMAETRVPFLISTGMSPLSEIDEAVARVKSCGLPLAVFQCTTAYPCPPEKLGLNLLPYFRERYRCPVGLSDHSGTIYPSLAALVLGAEIVEVHVTLSREMFGPDVLASVTPTELRQLVEGIRFIEASLSHPVDKDALAEEMVGMRKTFGKSIVAAQTLPAGHCLTPNDLAFKKPGTGIPAREVASVIGRRLSRPLPADTLIAETDLE